MQFKNALHFIFYLTLLSRKTLASLNFPKITTFSLLNPCSRKPYSDRKNNTKTLVDLIFSFSSPLLLDIVLRIGKIELGTAISLLNLAGPYLLMFKNNFIPLWEAAKNSGIF